MLTSYHYLLGSFMAVSCVTSAFFMPSPQYASYPAEPTIDVAYRGSGRLDGAPGLTQPGTKNISSQISQRTDHPDAAIDTGLSSDLGSNLGTELSALTTEEDSFLLSHRGSGRIVPARTTRL